VSRRITAGRSTEARDAQRFYLRSILEALAGELDPAQDAGGLERLCDELIPVLRGTGTTRLWSYVLPGVPEALAELRRARLRLVVVSNSDGTVERGLAEVGLRGLVDVVVDSHLVGFEKPDPRIFSHALSIFGSDPARTLHVGDTYAADIVGARAAGVHALLLDPHGDWGDVDCPVTTDVPALARRLLELRAARA
jgi:FMN phosphatase YigB (HAD superfamily)